MDVCFACMSSAVAGGGTESCRVVACVYKECCKNAKVMKSESPPASRGVQALRNMFAEKNTPVMGVLNAGIPHPHLIRKNYQEVSPPPGTTPLRIPRPAITPKPRIPHEEAVSREERTSPQPSEASRKCPPHEGTTMSSDTLKTTSSNFYRRDSSAPELPPRTNMPSKVVQHETKSPMNSQKPTEASEVCLHSGLAESTKSSNLSDHVNVMDGSEKRTCLVTTSDNYVCNSGTQRTVWKRKTLPSLRELGPPPAKPPRPKNLVLRRGESIQPPPRTRRTYHHSDVKPGVTATGRAPTPESPTSEEDHELYGDTGVPDEQPSPIQEYTEDEEYQLYADTETPPPPPPPPPVAKIPSMTTMEELYQDSSLCEELCEETYEEMPCSETRQLPSEVHPVQKEESAQEKKEREKREAAARRVQRKFGMSGLEEPLDKGVVRSSCRGGRLDLCIKKGETVDILRMEDNPPGKWLVRNNKGEVGYAQVTNIEVMVSRVQSMGNLNFSKRANSEEFCQDDYSEEAIYEETF